MNRKGFIKVAAGLAAFALPELPAGSEKPVMISTWDSGLHVNVQGWKILVNNGQGLDAIEAGGRYIEDQQDCCVGLGGYPDRDGIVTLDACIMDGDGNSGSVAALERIKHPISVARKLMQTPHIMLAGDGAQQFAIENGFDLEPQILSSESEKAYKEWLKTSEYKPVINIENKKGNGPYAPHFFKDGSPNHDTMGMIAIDMNGKLSGGVTTSGMAFKMHGRVGDSPVIGAGLFADNDAGAATSSGVGEEVIRICGTHLIVELMRQGFSPQQACKKAVERIVKRDPAKSKNIQVGFVAIDKNGRYGAYAIQKGFAYAVHNVKENRLFQSQYLI